MLSFEEYWKSAWKPSVGHLVGVQADLDLAIKEIAEKAYNQGYFDSSKRRKENDNLVVTL
jgi:hypothetical protein